MNELNEEKKDLELQKIEETICYQAKLLAEKIIPFFDSENITTILTCLVHIIVHNSLQVCILKLPDDKKLTDDDYCNERDEMLEYVRFVFDQVKSAALWRDKINAH